MEERGKKSGRRRGRVGLDENKQEEVWRHC